MRIDLWRNEMGRRNFNSDYDFIGFSYNGYHSIDDLNIYRVSDGNRYTDTLTATMKDTTLEAEGGNGTYFFGTQHTRKEIPVSFAFESLTEEGLRTLKKIFNGTEIHELIFDEQPYKVYDAKVSAPLQLKYIPFTTTDEFGKVHRTYKGEGSVTFVCYSPYAHTPRKTNKIKGKHLKSFVFEIDTECDDAIKNVIGRYPSLSGIDNPKDISNFTLTMFDNNNVSCSWRLEYNQNSKTWENRTEYSLNNISVIRLEINGELDQDFEYKIFIKLINSKNEEDKLSLVDDNYSGKSFRCYANTPTKKEWVGSCPFDVAESELKSKSLPNIGDISAPFILRREYTEIHRVIPINGIYKVGNLSITISGQSRRYGLEWNSKNGMVCAFDDKGNKIPIAFEGESLGGIPVGGVQAEDWHYGQSEDSGHKDDLTVEYDYWFY